MRAVFYGVLSALGLVLVESVPNSNPVFIEEARKVTGSRIVGGWEATDGQIPYQVHIRMVYIRGDVTSCGGSIIHHNWVITAAHCLAVNPTYVIRLGLTDITRPEYIVETDRRYMNPNYEEFVGAVQAHDIGLLELMQSIPYGPNIQPIRLQSSLQKDDNYDGLQLVASGYGLTNDMWQDGEPSELLRWVYLRGMSNEECRDWHEDLVHNTTICAGFYNETSQSICQGDSGGPLTLAEEDGKVTMVGIVSFTSYFCNSDYPSGFVRPGYYHNWFYEVTGISFDWDSDGAFSPSND